NNKKLLDKMPKVYAPVGVKTKDKHSTFYRVFTGPGKQYTGQFAMFEGIKGIGPAHVTDGLSNTIMVVEAGEPVPWTKPEDLPYDPKKPLPKLGGLFGGNFHIILGDGSVHFVRKGFDEETFRALITPAVGDFGDLKKLNKKKKKE